MTPLLARGRAPFLWTAVAVLLWAALLAAAIGGPSDPSGRRYGANWPGDLGSALRGGGFGIAVLVAIVRPWSYRRSWARAGVGSLLFWATGLFGLVICMHCGRVSATVYLWSLLVAVGLLVTSLVSAWVAVRSRGRPPPRDHPD